MTRPGWQAWFLGLALATGASGSAAQVSTRLNLYTSYTDNLFQNYSRRPDWVTLAYVNLDYAPGSALGLYYTGNANVFAEYGELFSHHHQAGLEYTWADEAGREVRAGGDAALRLDRPSYEYQDYLEGQAYFRARAYLGPALLSRAGYQLRYRRYPHAAEYTFAEQVLSVQVSRSLPSRTTLQAYGELGLKSYVDGSAPGTADPAQIVLRVKLAQSLADAVGLQTEYANRTNLAGPGRSIDAQAYDPDEDLFGDRYSYAGHEFRVATKYLDNSTRVEIGGQYARRRYPGRPALDLEGALLGAMRKDGRRGLSAEAERTFPLAGGFLQEVRLHLEWFYLDVDSNDPYYQSSTQVYSAGVQLGL